MVILALAGFIAAGLFLLAGCDDPGPAGKVYRYDNIVEIGTLTKAPSMGNPADPTWDEVPETVLRFYKDRNRYPLDNSYITMQVSAIKYLDRLYMRTYWRYDYARSVGAEQSVFDRTFTYPTITDSIYFVASPDSTFQGDTLVITQVYDQHSHDSTITNSTGIKDSIRTHHCVLGTIDTTYSIDSLIVNISTQINCTDTFMVLNYATRQEEWARADGYSLDSAKVDSVWHYNNPPADSTVIIDSMYYEYFNSGMDQDRVAIMWDMGDNGTEGANCMTMCHDVANPATGDFMYTSDGGHVDVWHWQAALTNPVYYAADEYWTDSGRAGDNLTTPIYETNWNGTRPIYMHQTDSLYKGKSYLLKTEAIAFDTAQGFWPNGYIMPAFVLNSMPSGSGADIDSYSWYNRNTGAWSVLMSRKLNTGYADDVDLSQIAAGDSVMTSIAVMDNATAIHYINEEPVYFIFK